MTSRKDKAPATNDNTKALIRNIERRKDAIQVNTEYLKIICSHIRSQSQNSKGSINTDTYDNIIGIIEDIDSSVCDAISHVEAAFQIPHKQDTEAFDHLEVMQNMLTKIRELASGSTQDAECAKFLSSPNEAGSSVRPLGNNTSILEGYLEGPKRQEGDTDIHFQASDLDSLREDIQILEVEIKEQSDELNDYFESIKMRLDELGRQLKNNRTKYLNELTEVFRQLCKLREHTYRLDQQTTSLGPQMVEIQEYLENIDQRTKELGTQMTAFQDSFKQVSENQAQILLKLKKKRKWKSRLNSMFKRLFNKNSSTTAV